MLLGLAAGALMVARGRALTAEELAELRRDARGLPRDASLRPWCEERADLLGCHPSTVYRAVRDVRPRRKRRSDAGELRSIDDDAMRDLGALVTQFDYDAELAIDTVNANRALAGDDPLELHPSTLRRILRDRGVGRRDNAQDLRVHRRWEAPYPSYLWQMDSTVAASWWIDTDDTVGYEAPVRRNKNKAGNGKPRIWLIGCVDDHSRVKWARFYTGNGADAWRDLLLRAMRGFDELDDWPAFGIPERIYTDQDSAVKSGQMTRLFDVLEIERILAHPSTEHETNAQAKGKVERALGVILHGFEKTLRKDRVTSLSELNRLLLRYLMWSNNRVHSETGVAPFERWLTKDDVRTLPAPEIMARLTRREVERVITSAVTIRLEGRVYQLPRRRPFVDFIGRRVGVLYHEADPSTIAVRLGGEEFEVDAVEALPDQAGEVRAAETPAAVALKRELLARDLGHIDAHAVHDFRVERDPRSYPIRPQTTPFIPAEIPATMTIRRGRAIDLAQAAGVVAVPPSDLDRVAIAALFADRREIPETEFRAWLEDRQQLPTHKRAEQA